MAAIKNFRKVTLALEKLERESRRKDSGNVLVGFTASYAIYVHEMTMKHKGKPRTGKHVSGQKKKGKFWDGKGPNVGPKFLETPAREMKSELAAIISKAAINGAPLIKALLIAGLALQREAQMRVPIDTGNLRGSAFTAKE